MRTRHTKNARINANREGGKGFCLGENSFESDGWGEKKLGATAHGVLTRSPLGSGGSTPSEQSRISLKHVTLAFHGYDREYWTFKNENLKRERAKEG